MIKNNFRFKLARAPRTTSFMYGSPHPFVRPSIQKHVGPTGPKIALFWDKNFQSLTQKSFFVSHGSRGEAIG